MRPGRDVHEIIPKSLSGSSWDILSNRILLCAECHGEVHRRGATNRIEDLNFYWCKRLVDFYGNENRLAESGFIP